MEKISKEEIWKFDRPFGEPDLAEIWWTKGDFKMQRLERNNEIFWFGHGINWNFKDEQWYKLKNNDFVECDECIYETMIKELKDGN